MSATGAEDTATPDPLLRLRDDAALETAVADRLRLRDGRDRALETASWVGTLRDLAEQEVAVVVTTGAQVHRAVLAAVGVDHVVLRLPDGTLALVALDQVRAVRPEPGVPAPPAMGDRGSSQDRTLAEVLEQLVGDRVELAVGLRDVAQPVRGRVLGVGEDVLSLAVTGSVADGHGATVYVPLAGIREVLLTP